MLFLKISTIFAEVKRNIPLRNCGSTNFPINVLEAGSTVLTWEFIQHNFPWHVLFIVGGGLAISDGANASGLSVWFGEQLQGLERLSRHVILLLIVLIISLLTELMSNAAAVSLLTPILIALVKFFFKF